MSGLTYEKFNDNYPIVETFKKCIYPFCCYIMIIGKIENYIYQNLFTISFFYRKLAFFQIYSIISCKVYDPIYNMGVVTPHHLCYTLAY